MLMRCREKKQQLVNNDICLWYETPYCKPIVVYSLL